MLRLIGSRRVRLALAAVVVVAAVAVAVLRFRRGPAPSGPVSGAAGNGEAPRGSDAQASGVRASGARASREAAAAAPWPPVPVLGIPTDADLARYAAAPYEPGELPPPRPPLDEAARRRVVRWGAAAIALCVLVFAAQALETAVFSDETATGPEYTEEHVYPEDLQDLFADRDCTPPTREAGGMLRTFCVAVVERTPPASGDGDVPEDSAPQAEDLSAAARGEAAEPSGTAPDEDCRPGTGTPAVRKVNPRVTRAVNRQWARIERWLRANAPGSHRTLAPPARARTIAVAEAQMGLRFPDDLRASLLRHNGSVHAGRVWGFGFLMNESLGVRAIRDTWRGLCETDAGDGADDPRSDWWDGRMIPVGSDGLGNHLVVDSVRRDVGGTDHEGSMDFAPGGVRIRSYHALLKLTADALERGGSIGFWKPVVVGGELDWTVADG
ncbi:SMI1/KNR4 family protein [Planomonospora venezuelensis]|uniref:Cell wall assembly regulator SMI1 n=1 Tax=Planomonospora venezuelensis TaxID=1999 RepID=A0A841CWI2_PLAVE|nr:cell wall assembly regulator SMI1 [Planomonospora venezuelensis]GIM98887.1 hypothetical protein Pve01_05460 [Planomonospora venezuelensis]